jgi:hypothetical protein
MRAAFLKLAPLTFGAIPLALALFAAYTVHTQGNLGIDFRYELYPEAQLVLHGHDPFQPANALSSGENRVFPVPAALLVAPLTVLSPMAAAVIWTAMLLAILAGTLLLLGVRDWRVFGLVCLWPSTLSAVQSGNITILLAFLGALAWRTREREWLPGVAVGGAIALKLFVWPLVVWLIAIRRFRSAATAVAFGAATLLLALPFASLRSYLELMNNLDNAFARDSYSVVGLLTQTHLASRGAATAVATLAGVAVIAAAWSRRSFPLALVAAIVLAPLVWTHYFMLLALPLAIRWPRLAPAWALPLALEACPGSHWQVRPWHIVVALAVLAATAVVVERLQPFSARRITATFGPLYSTLLPGRRS